MTPERIPQPEIHPKSIYILGVDPARSGKDETAFVVLEQLFKDPTNIFVSYIETIDQSGLDVVINRIKYLDKIFRFKKIIIDETGLGGGVVDVVKNEVKTPVEGIWYTNKSKNEMFNNLKLLMSKKRLFFPDYNLNHSAICKKLYFQFLSIQKIPAKVDTGTESTKITHNAKSHDDLINALALACTYFNLRKRLNNRYNLIGKSKGV